MGMDCWLDKVYCVGCEGAPATALIKNPAGAFAKDVGEYKNVVAITCHVARWDNGVIDPWLIRSNAIDEEETRCAIDTDTLVELREQCKEVLAHREKAEDLLPIDDDDGEYDEYYFEMLEYTAEALEGVEKDANAVFYYERSW